MVVSQAMMAWRIRFSLFVILLQVFCIAGLTNPDDFVVLRGLRDGWDNVPPNWDGEDPCGTDWDGIKCINDRVISISLSSISLSGHLTSDIGRLSELQILDLSYNKDLTGPLPLAIGDLQNLTSLILVGCGFSGPIPSSIGSLKNLVYLSLNSNKFVGPIPSSIGNLPNLYWLDLADNELTGTIPVSSGSTPGLDMLLHTKHFHFGRNQLSGELPSQLFSSNMSLAHLLLETNQLTGTIPSTLGLLQSLEVLRLDKNSLNGSVPWNLNNLTSLQELYLANNQLTGLLPNLTGMHLLNYVDLSNNSFVPADIPLWFSSLQSLTTLIMEDTRIEGQLPVTMFDSFQLQTVKLKNNRINGTLNVGATYSSQLQLIDLQDNFIDNFPPQANYNVQTLLIGNPVCMERPGESFCTFPRQSISSYSTPAENCMPNHCTSDEVSSPTCKCAYPYTGTLVFRAPSFSNFGNSTVFSSLHDKLMNTCRSHGLPVDSVVISDPTKNVDNYLLLNLQIFPSGQDFFDHRGVSSIGFLLSNQSFKPPPGFGPFYFSGNCYQFFAGLKEGSHNSRASIISGAACGGTVFFFLLCLIVTYAFRLKRKAEIAAKKSDPFVSWDPKTNNGGVPQLKGAKYFSFDELKKCTNNFSDFNNVGRGGYGVVYKGTLPNGQLLAIKRAQQGSMQGSLEFKTEIELLSRVHHRNVVSLIGFCFEHGEQMLVYEFIANGTLKDGLTGRSGVRLDWLRRLRIAVGAARGLQYLHDLADPPIIHRDIKSNNILLDERLNAKVADFGISKLKDECEQTHVSTQVKGTMGYLDPEYYMTNQLTEKSDVYSFGIVLLELLTARNPIEKGKSIVTEVKRAMDMNDLRGILDRSIASAASPRSIEKLVDLALACVQGLGDDRPAMSDVVKEIENIMVLTGLNPHAESRPASISSGKGSRNSYRSSSSDDLFAYSGFHLSANLELK